MKRIKVIWYFQRKLLLPALAVSLIIGHAIRPVNNFSLASATLLSFFFILPLMHYFVYDTSNGREYYFYHNLGFSRFALWGRTVAVGTACLILSIFL